MIVHIAPGLLLSGGEAARELEVINSASDGSAAFGFLLHANPLEAGGVELSRFPERSRVVVWSGTLASTLFGRDPLGWGPATLDSFRAWCAGAHEVCEQHGMIVLLRPHARHALCDVPRCLAFLREYEGSPHFGIALEPVAMLEASMLDAAEDHLRRIFESLGSRAGALILTNVAHEQPGGDAAVARVAFEAGRLDPGALGKLVRASCPAELPLILAHPAEV